jgi:hypothetical protein
MSCDNNVTSSLSVGMLQQRKEANFSWQHMCCLYFGVTTGTDWWVKYFKQAKCLPKYIFYIMSIFRPYKYVPRTKTRSSPKDQLPPPPAGAHDSLRTSVIVTKLVMIFNAFCLSYPMLYLRSIHSFLSLAMYPSVLSLGFEGTSSLNMAYGYSVRNFWTRIKPPFIRNVDASNQYDETQWYAELSLF